MSHDHEPGEGDPSDALTSTDPTVVASLVENHRRFLQFLERRVESRDAAEDILQAAMARALAQHADHSPPVHVVPWFFRSLRNAVVDHYRRRAARERGRAAYAAEAASAVSDEEMNDEEMRAAVCDCFMALLPTLKPEYARILHEVDLLDRPLVDVAVALGISQNNAGVRLHRARRALRARLEQVCRACAQHGCLDCSCERARRGSHDG